MGSKLPKEKWHFVNHHLSHAASAFLASPFEEAAVMLVGLDIDRIEQGLEILATQPRGAERVLRMVSDYAIDNVSDKVLRIMVSYTDFVRRRVWRQERPNSVH